MQNVLKYFRTFFFKTYSILFLVQPVSLARIIPNSSLHVSPHSLSGCAKIYFVSGLWKRHAWTFIAWLQKWRSSSALLSCKWMDYHQEHNNVRKHCMEWSGNLLHGVSCTFWNYYIYEWTTYIKWTQIKMFSSTQEMSLVSKKFSKTQITINWGTPDLIKHCCYVVVDSDSQHTSCPCRVV